MKNSFRPVLVVILCLISILFFEGLAAAALTKTPTLPGTNDYILLKSPSNLKYTCTGAGFVTLTWTDNSNNEEGFMIERKPQGGAWDTLESLSANTTTYEQSQMSNYPVFPGEKFYYRVKAFMGSKSSGYSNELYVVVSDNTTPIAPGSLKLETYRSTVMLTWTDRSNNETGFQIEMKEEGGVYQKIRQIGSESTQCELSVSEANMQGGKKYTFLVKAFNDSGSAASSEVSYTMPSSAPGAPTNLLIQNCVGDLHTNRLNLVWTDTSSNEDGFLILRKNVTDNTDFDLYTNPTAVVGKNATQYEDKNLSYDKVYAYKVGAFNLAGHNFSSASQASTGPKPPELHAYAMSNEKVRVYWTLKSNQTNYCRLDRKAEGEGSFQAINYFHNQEYIDTNVSPSKTYTYRVGAFTGGFSWSNEVAVTIPASSITPVTVDKNIILPGAGLPSAAKRVIRLNLGQTAYRVDNEVRQMDTAPISQEGRTLLPVRYVTEALGATLDWDGAVQKVTIKQGNKTIELWIGKNTALVNGGEVLIDSSNPKVMPISVPPGRTMLPVRFITENLGCQVDWDPVLQEIKINYTNP